MTIPDDLRPLLTHALRVACPEAPWVDCARLANAAVTHYEDGDRVPVAVCLALLRQVLQEHA